MSMMKRIMKIVVCLMFIVVSLSISMPLQGMKFITTLKSNREKLEQQVIILTKAGDNLLLTGSALQEKLINEISKQQKELIGKKELVKVPYSLVVEPFKFFETELTKEAQKKPNDLAAQVFYNELNKIIRGDLFQKTYTTVFSASLQVAKIPTLPDVLKNLMTLLDKVDTTIGSVKARFEPIVREIFSYVDIEQAKTALNLSANSYSVVNLEFVNKYRDYVNKVYAEKTGGGTFDSRGVYSGLWSAIQHFNDAIVRMKKIEDFFAGMKLK